MDMHDKKQRERYVKACLEQMAEASKELETLGSEYNLVTSYLTDMEEIDALPPEIREQLGNMAKKIVDIEDNQKQQQNKKKTCRMKNITIWTDWQTACRKAVTS